MRYALGINFEGSAAIEPNESGGGIVGLSGSGSPPESTDQWRLSLHARPSAGAGAIMATALEVVGPLRDRIEATLADESVDTVTDGAGSADSALVDLHFAVVGGTGSFSGAAGSIHLHGTVLPQGFRLTANLDLETPAEPWRPPAGRPISPQDDAAGGSHVGAEPGSQKPAEAEAEQGLVRRSQERSG